MPCRRSLLVTFATLPLGLHAQAPPIVLDAPNPVVISPRLVTSGQPTARALADLGRQGFQAVIYLAPSTVDDAVKDEPALLAAQGIEFVHIPIPFQAPTEAHRIALSQALLRLADRQVLVHCQVNMRASTLVFLHRVIEGREDPARAYEAVARVWSPQGAWRRLMLEQLAKHQITFEPL